jgi:hypothetical protein
MGRARTARIIAAGACLTAVGCKGCPAPRQAVFALSADIDQPGVAALRRQLVDSFAASGDALPAASSVGTSLSRALAGGDPAQITVGKPSCFPAGCWVDVDYRERAAFPTFDTLKIHDGESLFRRWPFASGRTGLLSGTGNRLYATWYFFQDYRSVDGGPPQFLPGGPGK